MSDAYPEISPKGAYVSTGNFASEIYSYTVSLNSNLATVGTLANITKLPDNVTVLVGSSYACPANRILHVTGKKLLPGRDPITVNTTSPATSATFFVGVLDPITGLNGFIDPTSKTFARYTNDAIVVDDGTKPFNANQSFGGPLPGGVGTKLSITGTAGTLAAPLTLTGTAIGNDLAAAAGSATTGFVPYPSGGANTNGIVINTTAVTANSIILLSSQDGLVSDGVNSSTSVIISRVPGTSFSFNYLNGDGGIPLTTVARTIGWVIIN
jgi:hypothetical protein